MEGIITGKVVSVEALRIVTCDGLSLEEVVFLMNGGYTEIVNIDENDRVVLPFEIANVKRKVIRIKTDKHILAEVHGGGHTNSGLNWSVSNVQESEKLKVEVLRNVVRVVPKTKDHIVSDHFGVIEGNPI
jgi:hypothetical protein